VGERVYATGMDWLRSHPYADALLAAGALLIIGALVVHQKTSVSPAASDLATWGGAGGVLVNGVSSGGTGYAQGPQETGPGTQAVSVGYIPLTPGDTQADDTTLNATDNFDFGAFAAALAQPAKGQPQQDTGAESDAYAFIPTALIATTTLVQQRTALQNNLYLYGNDVGGTIQSFEYAHPDQPAVLKNFIEDRTSPDTIAAMKKLGTDLAAIGTTFDGTGPVPTQAVAAHKALAAAYKDIGTKLAAIPDAQGDDKLMTAIDTYDSAAESFVKKYVALALVFQSYGVIFSPGDGGAIFIFPDGGGL